VGTYNTAIGYLALLYASTGTYNVALGPVALISNTTGNYNTAIGASALRSTITSNSNTAVGINAGYSTTGSSNTLLGRAAGGDCCSGGLTTGSSNTIIGASVGSTTLATGSNNILIGTSSSAVDTTASDSSNELNIGNTIYGDLSADTVGIGTSAPNTNLDVNGFVEWSGQSRVTSTFSKTSSTALAAITNLSATLTAGKTYYFDIMLYTTSNTLGGIKADLNGGTATATSIIGDAFSFDAGAVKTQTRVAALNTSLCAVTAVTVANCHITGTITVNVGGTFKPQFAQNSSNGTASTVAIGSTMIVNQIN
jgi:hypothetical protein